MLKAEADLGPVSDTIASGMSFSHDPDVVELLISTGRFRSYLSAAGDDRERAVALYRWNVAVSAACFEAFHYVEVVVRNAMDREMQIHRHEAQSRIPWFLLPVVGKHRSSFDDSIEKVRRRLRDQHHSRETRDQIVAGTDFGFWTALLHSENEDLWRSALHRAFPGSSGKRKDVAWTTSSGARPRHTASARRTPRGTGDSRTSSLEAGHWAGQMAATRSSC